MSWPRTWGCADLRRGQDRRRARVRRRDRVVRDQARPVLPGQVDRRWRADRRFRRSRRRDGRDREASRPHWRSPAPGSRTPRSPAAPHASPIWAPSTAIPLSMAAGVAVLTQILTRESIRARSLWAIDLPLGCQAVYRRVRSARLRGQRRAQGLRNVHAESVSPTTGTSSDSIRSCGRRRSSILVNRGVLLPPGPDDQWTLSVQHTDEDVDRYVSTFRASRRSHRLNPPRSTQGYRALPMRPFELG